MVHELEEERKLACRLTPDRALDDVEQAAAFLTDRGMLTRFPDCALPSLFGACHEEPGRAGGRGFDLWPKTKWVFSFQLSQHRGTVLTKVHRGKSLYLSMDAARSFDRLVRRSIEDAIGDEALLLDHLDRHGPSAAEDVELELRWPRERLKRAPESDLKSWFTWPIPAGTVERLVEEGRLVRPAAGLVAMA